MPQWAVTEKRQRELIDTTLVTDTHKARCTEHAAGYVPTSLTGLKLGHTGTSAHFANHRLPLMLRALLHGQMQRPHAATLEPCLVSAA